MNDTSSQETVRTTPTQALRRPLYDPRVRRSDKGRGGTGLCACPLWGHDEPAETTDPSIYDLRADDTGLALDEATLDAAAPEELRATAQGRPSAVYGVALLIGIVGGSAAMAAVVVVALAGLVGAAVVSESSATITDFDGPTFQLP